MDSDSERRLLETILRHSPEDIDALNNDGDTPLHIAIANDNSVGIEVFIRYGANVNIRNKKGNTPLHIAIERRDEIAIDLLIEKFANLDLANKEGNSPLHLAAHYCEPDAIRRLIQAGAKLNVCNNEENAPLHIVLNFCKVSVTKELARQRDEPHHGIDKEHLEANVISTVEECLLFDIDISQIISSAEILIKHAILEDCDLYESWYQTQKSILLPEIYKLLEDCFSAVRCMKSTIINGRFPFYHLVFGKLGNPPILWKSLYAELAINHVLEARREYSVYFDMIGARFDKFILIFEMLRVSTDTKCRSILVKKILDEDLISYISDYLSNVDILNLTAAFLSA